MAVRPFQMSDIAGVNQLHKDIGWTVPSFELWQWLADNPARANAPIGWVIDNDGRIDGFLGSFRLGYYRGSTRYTSTTSHSVIVSPRVKGAIRDLILPFLDQKDTFATTILNANEVGSPVYRRYGVKPLRAPTHDLKLSWIVGPTLAIAAKIMRRMAEHFPALYPVFGERFTPYASIRFDARRVRWPKNIFVLEDLGDNSSLGQFWADLKNEGQLVVDRSPATLRWRLSMPDQVVKPLLLGYYDQKGLCAYALGQLSKMGPLDIPTVEIIDMIALNRAPAQAIPTLVKSMQMAAEKMGALKVRLPLVSPKLYEQLAHKAKTAHREGGWGHAFAVFNVPEHELDDWQPTAFEGSYSFTLRPPHFKLGKNPYDHRKAMRLSENMLVSET